MEKIKVPVPSFMHFAVVVIFLKKKKSYQFTDYLCTGIEVNMSQQRHIFLFVDNTSKITILTLPQWLNLKSFKGWNELY